MVWELLGLFIAFAKEEDQRRAVPGAARTEAVAPNALREALHDLDSRLFSIGAHLRLFDPTLGSPEHLWSCTLCGWLPVFGMLRQQL